MIALDPKRYAVRRVNTISQPGEEDMRGNTMSRPKPRMDTYWGRTLTTMLWLFAALVLVLMSGFFSRPGVPKQLPPPPRTSLPGTRPPNAMKRMLGAFRG